jgi:hypothetical protein
VASITLWQNKVKPSDINTDNYIKMGTCRYCGQEAGFLRSAHAECEQKHKAKQAVKEFRENVKKDLINLGSDPKFVDYMLDKTAIPNKEIIAEKLIDIINSDFTDSEKERLDEIYQQMRVGLFVDNVFNGNTKTRIVINGENELYEQLRKATNPGNYFCDLLKGTNPVSDYALCEKIINIIDDNKELLFDEWSLHFYYITRMEIYYRNRDIIEGAFDKAVESCLKMIDIAKKLSTDNSKIYPDSNPSHPGYKQLAIILMKQHKYQEVIDLCQQAKSQYWKGDWDERIERAEQKLKNKKN